MLAASVLVVADQTPERDPANMALKGDGFSKLTFRNGKRIAKWVRPSFDSERQRWEDLATDQRFLDALTPGEKILFLAELETVRNQRPVRPGKPISDGYWLKKAGEVVSTHANQIGRLQVSIGALDVAMAEIEESHGVTGLQAAFAEAMAMQERPAKVERIDAPKPAKKAAKAQARVNVGSAPAPTRWGSCS
jgi:hypothetical protein